MYAQAKAWADRPFSLAWLNNTLAAHLLERELHEGDRPKTLVICDNLDAHVFGAQYYVMQHARIRTYTTIWLNCFTTTFKIQDTWLDDSANFDAWEVALFSYFNCYLYEYVYIYGKKTYFTSMRIPIVVLTCFHSSSYV